MEERIEANKPITLVFIEMNEIHLRDFDSHMTTDSNASVDYMGHTYRCRIGEDYYVNGSMRYAVVVNLRKLEDAISDLKRAYLQGLLDQRERLKRALRNSLVNYLEAKEALDADYDIDNESNVLL